MSDSEKRKQGKRKMREISQIPAFDPPDAFTEATIDDVFGGLWQRPGLADRDRRLLTLAVVGARGMEFEAKTHIRGALKTDDLTPAEVMEAILHIAYYSGWPSASILYRSLRAVCTELGLEIPGPDAEVEPPAR